MSVAITKSDGGFYDPSRGGSYDHDYNDHDYNDHGSSVERRRVLAEHQLADAELASAGWTKINSPTRETKGDESPGVDRRLARRT